MEIQDDCDLCQEAGSFHSYNISARIPNIWSSQKLFRGTKWFCDSGKAKRE